MPLAKKEDVRMFTEKQRYLVMHADLNASRREWCVFDTKTNKTQSYGFYARKSQAKVACDRWNSDHAIAEIEAPRA
jgi:hypothetical protein